MTLPQQPPFGVEAQPHIGVSLLTVEYEHIGRPPDPAPPVTLLDVYREVQALRADLAARTLAGRCRRAWAWLRRWWPWRR